MPSEGPRNPDELGALWLKTNAKGQFMTGTINGMAVVVFPNDRKTEDKQPDYRVLKARSQDGAGRRDDQRQAPQRQQPPQQRPSAPPPRRATTPPPYPGEEDDPFR